MNPRLIILTIAGLLALSACSQTQLQQANSAVAKVNTDLAAVNKDLAAAEPAVNAAALAVDPSASTKLGADESYVNTAVADAQLFGTLVGAVLPATTGT